MSKYNGNCVSLCQSDLLKVLLDLGLTDDKATLVVKKVSEIARAVQIQTYLKLSNAVAITSYEPQGGILPGNSIGSGPWVRAMKDQFESTEYERQQEYFGGLKGKSFLDL